MRVMREDATPSGLRFAPLGAFALVASVALLAQAAGIGVHQNRSIDTVFAERVHLSLLFEVTETRLDRALLGLPAVGGPRHPAEIAEVPTPAATTVAAGDWTYSVVVVEREPASVPEGSYSVALRWDGRLVGRVHFVQDVANPLLREGVRVTFALGAERPQAPLFVVHVEREDAPAISYRLKSAASVSGPVWTGVGGEIEGQTNPDLAGAVGEPLRITIENGDASLHNLRVRDGDDVVAGPTSDVGNIGDEAVLDWTPTDAGTFVYECQYHADSMTGELIVT